MFFVVSPHRVADNLHVAIAHAGVFLGQLLLGLCPSLVGELLLLEDVPELAGLVYLA